MKAQSLLNNLSLSSHQLMRRFHGIVWPQVFFNVLPLNGAGKWSNWTLLSVEPIIEFLRLPNKILGNAAKTRLYTKGKNHNITNIISQHTKQLCLAIGRDFPQRMLGRNKTPPHLYLFFFKFADKALLFHWKLPCDLAQTAHQSQ